MIEEYDLILNRIKSRQKEMENLSSYLGELESQLSLLFAYSPDLIILTKDDGEILKVNNTAGRILGYSPNEMVGKNVWDFVAEGDREKTLKFRDSILDGSGDEFFIKNDIYFINHWRKKCGGFARLVWRYAFYDKRNKWVIKFATDFSGIPVDSPYISELLVTSIENVRSGFVITDNLKEENPIIYANKAFMKYSGYTKDQLIGYNCRILNQEDRDQAALSTVRGAVKSGKSIDVLLKNFKPDGTAWYNFLVLEPVFENNVLSKFIGSSRDVTEQVMANQIKWDRHAPRGFGHP